MVAFLVDGDLEKKFIENVCPGKKILKILCNGKTVSTEAMAKRIATLWRTLGNRYFPVIVCVDLEDRNLGCNDFADDLLEACRNHGVQGEIIIGVADKMIENWILADKKVAVDTIGIDMDRCAEGCNGKSEIKKVHRSYHETTDGVNYLKACCPSRMQENSPSFAAFHNKIKAHLGDCWWMSEARTLDSLEGE